MYQYASQEDKKAHVSKLHVELLDANLKTVIL